MTETLFSGRRALWLWMFAAQAERTWAEALATARQLAGAKVLLVKALDGQTWMSAFDSGQGALDGLARLRQLQDVAAGQGCEVVPWVVPHDRTDAAAHAALGTPLLVDLEPYARFWTDTAAGVVAYLAGLRAGGVRELYVSIDPRPAARAALGVAEWAQTVTGLLPQLYWTDFGTTPEACLVYLAQCQALGAPVFPVLPGDGAAAFAGFWAAARAQGCAGVSAWRLGSMDAAALRSFAGLAVAPLSGEDDLAALRQQLAALAAERDGLRATLAAVRQALS